MANCSTLSGGYSSSLLSSRQTVYGMGRYRIAARRVVRRIRAALGFSESSFLSLIAAF